MSPCNTPKTVLRHVQKNVPNLLGGTTSRSKLLEQVRKTARMKLLSYATEKSYVQTIRRYILFHNKRHPAEMGAEEIRAYLAHPAVERHVAAATQNVALSALLFLYRDVLQIELPYVEEIPWTKKPGRLPTVFTRSEVRAFLDHLEGTHHLIVSLLYGSGLRLTEALRLRVKARGPVADAVAPSLKATTRAASSTL